MVASKVTAPATMVDALPEAPTKEGHDFGGWYTERFGEGTEFTSATEVIASIRVYAKWTVVTPPPAIVSGTITLPSAVSGKKWYVRIDADSDFDDGVDITVTGMVTGTSFSYELTDVPAGTYYLFAVVDNDDSWGTDLVGQPEQNDFWAFYDMSGVLAPEEPSLTVPATGALTVDLDLTSYGSGGGTASISGTMTLGSSVTDKEYFIFVDTDSDGGNGIVAMTSGKANGTSVSYTVDEVPAGTYFVMGFVDTDDSGIDGGLTIDDFFGVYGYSTYIPSDSDPNVVVPASGTVTCDFATWTVTSNQGPGGGTDTHDPSAALAALVAGKEYGETLPIGSSGPAYITLSGRDAIYTYNNFTSGAVTLNGTVYALFGGARIGDIDVSGDQVTHVYFNSNPIGTAGWIVYEFDDGTVWKADLSIGAGSWEQVSETPATTNEPMTGADGTWSDDSGPVFTISDSLIMSGVSSTGATLMVDSSGNLYAAFAGVEFALTGYTWDGTTLAYNGTALTKGSDAGDLPDLTDLPEAADGTWSYAGTVLLTISNSSYMVSGQNVPLSYAADGQLYYVVSGNPMPFTGYVWNGSTIVMSGIDLTKGTVSTTPIVLSDLPAAANGTWSYAGSPMFEIAGSSMTLSGQTTAVQYDTNTGALHMVVSGSTVPLTGYVWNGSAMVMSGLVLTKS